MAMVDARLDAILSSRDGNVKKPLGMSAKSVIQFCAKNITREVVFKFFRRSGQRKIVTLLSMSK